MICSVLKRKKIACCITVNVFWIVCVGLSHPAKTVSGLADRWLPVDCLSVAPTVCVGGGCLDLNFDAISLYPFLIWHSFRFGRG